MHKASYNHDFPSLEWKLEKAYRSFCLSNCNCSRTELYSAIKEIAYGILQVGEDWKDKNIDWESTSYEYALYLLERIMVGKFRPSYDSDKFPWSVYINKNLKHVVETCREDNVWHELVKDLEYLVDQRSEALDRIADTSGDQEDFIWEKQLSVNLYKSLRIFYSSKEIRRLLPIAIDLISSDEYNFSNRGMSKDIKDFVMVLIALSKRLSVDHDAKRFYEVPKSEFKKAMSASVRSSLFLSTVTNSNIFPKELLLSLDIDSLYRLVQVSGGRYVRIPNQNELDSLMAAVLSVSKRILEGKKIDDSLNVAKKDLNLMFSKQINIQEFVTKMVKTIEIHGEDKESEPLIKLLSNSLKNVDTLVDKYLDVKLSMKEENKKTYRDVVRTLNKPLPLKKRATGG